MVRGFMVGLSEQGLDFGVGRWVKGLKSRFVRSQDWSVCDTYRPISVTYNHSKPRTNRLLKP